MSTRGSREAKQWLAAFGRAVRERRAECGLSQEALGYRCSLDRTYVSGIERGVRNPTLSTIMRLAEGLETTVSGLLQKAEAELGAV